MIHGTKNSQVDCLFVAESEDGPIAERYTSISVEASDLQEFSWYSFC